MALGSSVLTNDSLLSRLDQRLFKFESSLALIGGIAVFSLMLLAVFSVSGRKIINQPLPGYVDWIEQLMPVIALIGVSFTQRLGGHIRMDLLVSKLRGRLLWIAEFISVFLILGLMILLVWGSWAHFDRSFDFASPLWSRDSSIDISIPLWPAKLVAPIGFSVLCIRLVLQLWGYALAIISGTDNPVAVPLIEDVVTQAAKEAESVSGFEEENEHGAN